ncbi:inositol monophosphatase family protein [Geodermatophilus ruber]|uniref:3'(2'), 5'-bisphosphate nucleotidase n=1 Tax=Geodermatophilus ruber TaxID=504800 RepID=A0A1I4CZ75_9ACTN|nr:inositol monophosphatase family protein [Geodermatophilus ruber]SFK86195.1 3'(2'), 5'-bisphosphate nucleotidase [Geodermatophilus ruber]
MAEPEVEGRAGPGPVDLRVATTGEEVRAVAAASGIAPAALAAARHDPSLRLLTGPFGRWGLLRREWAEDGTAETVLVRRAGVGIDQPGVLAAAASWGCGRVRDERRGDVLPVPEPPAEAPLAHRFLHLAALAATRVEAAVALTRDAGPGGVKDDGSPALPADEAAQLAAAQVLTPLGVPLLSEERPDRPVADGTPWVVLDPLDGTGNFRAGLPPWAFSAALVQGGRPVAGLVVDLSSGRRWEGAVGAGARRDGAPVGPRPGGTVLVPSAPGGGTVAVPTTARRVRVTGCTAVDLCLVADGSAAAWQDVDRSGTHVHDVAGGLAVLAAAGGVALTPDGGPLALQPDTGTLIRLVAAGSERTARELLSALR